MRTWGEAELTELEQKARRFCYARTGAISTDAISPDDDLRLAGFIPQLIAEIQRLRSLTSDADMEELSRG